MQDMDENDFRLTQPRFAEEAFEKNLAVVKVVEEIASAKEATAAQVALAWLLHKGRDIVPIPGTKRVKYLEENASSVALRLSGEEMEKLDEISGKILGERYSPELMKAVNS
jgi:aryl-alcohol dehydrogenase-like predicted oxidoreductase